MCCVIHFVESKVQCSHKYLQTILQKKKKKKKKEKEGKRKRAGDILTGKVDEMHKFDQDS